MSRVFCRQTSCCMAHGAQRCTPSGGSGPASAWLQLLEEHYTSASGTCTCACSLAATALRTIRPTCIPHPPCPRCHSSFMMHKIASRPVQSLWLQATPSAGQHIYVEPPAQDTGHTCCSECGAGRGDTGKSQQSPSPSRQPHHHAPSASQPQGLTTHTTSGAFLRLRRRRNHAAPQLHYPRPAQEPSCDRACNNATRCTA